MVVEVMMAGRNMGALRVSWIPQNVSLLSLNRAVICSSDCLRIVSGSAPVTEKVTTPPATSPPPPITPSPPVPANRMRLNR